MTASLLATWRRECLGSLWLREEEGRKGGEARSGQVRVGTCKPRRGDRSKNAGRYQRRLLLSSGSVPGAPREGVLRCRAPLPCSLTCSLLFFLGGKW